MRLLISTTEAYMAAAARPNRMPFRPVTPPSSTPEMSTMPRMASSTQTPLFMVSFSLNSSGDASTMITGAM